MATGPTGRAMLVHGQDTMLLGPGTKIAIPYKPDSGLDTTVFEQTGTVDLSIEHLAAPHFSVQTPYLAAVVKGTAFNVTVTAGAANVTVTRGVVGVSDLKTGERSDVAAGQSAGVSSTQGGGLRVGGKKAAPQVRAGKPQKSVVAPTAAQARAEAEAQAEAVAASAPTQAGPTAATAIDDASLAELAAPSNQGTRGGSRNSSAGRQSTGSKRGDGSGKDPGQTSHPAGDPVTRGWPVSPSTPPTKLGPGGLAGWLESHSHPPKSDDPGNGEDAKGNKGKNGDNSTKGNEGKGGGSGK